MGILNFYHRFIPNCAQIVYPLTTLLAGQYAKDFTWTPAADKAFSEAKEALAHATMLGHPVPDAITSIMTDASNHAAGAVLQQQINGQWTLISFFSRKFTATETRYSTFDRELLAIFLAIKLFRYFVEGRPFHILTDHKPLTFSLATNPNRYSPRQARQLDFISQYTTDIRHVSGANNPVADALSRINIDTVTQFLPSLDLKAVAQAQLNDDQLQMLRQSSTSLKLEPQDISTQGTIIKLVCDTSTGTPRLYLPRAFRYQAFELLHSLSHPGVKASQRLIASSFVWPSMKTDIRKYTLSCLHCQRSKIHQHTRSTPGTFSVPDARFSHVHVDLVGPLPISQGFRYIFTCVDRFTRWPEAIPIVVISAKTVAHAFFSGWIARFGIPTTVTTDRGGQFESMLWAELMHLLGTIRTRTTAYHPCANGMVERFHRQLKAALKCHNHQDWSTTLPIVLLGNRTALKSDLQCSASDMVYGTTLRLPGAFFTPTDTNMLPSSVDFVQTLKEAMQKLQPVPPREVVSATKINPALHRNTHVFVRQDGVCKPLQAPYKGPFRVLSRSSKHFTIDVDGRHEIISIDCLKPAFTDLLDTTSPLPISPPVQPSTAEANDQPNPFPTTLRSGRKVHFPNRLTYSRK